MPPLESLLRPLRLKMKGWSQKRQKWQASTTQALAAVEEGSTDCFTQLEQMKQVAVDCARKVCGEAGGKMRSLIPHHSKEFRKLKERLTLLKVVRREIHARRNTGQQSPSRAMRRAWDEGLYPQPCSFLVLSSLWAPTNQGWTESWLRRLRQQSQTKRRRCTFSGVQNCITQPRRAGRLQLLGFMMVGSCAASFTHRHRPCTARCCARVCQTALWSLGMVYPCRQWQLTFSTWEGSTLYYKGALSWSQEFDLWIFSPL